MTKFQQELRKAIYKYADSRDRNLATSRTNSVLEQDLESLISCACDVIALEFAVIGCGAENPVELRAGCDYYVNKAETDPTWGDWINEP